MEDVESSDPGMGALQIKVMGYFFKKKIKQLLMVNQ
jgi:hypothetical protein